MPLCPTSQTLELYLENTLSQSDFETLELHLRHCSNCNAYLERRTDEPALACWVSAGATSHQSFTTESGMRIGSYRIIAEIARGGMGVVYRAHDESVGRDVALKLLPNGANFRQIDRSHREIQAAGSITNDHIVPVYAADVTADGHTYLVMPLIEGITLKEKLRNGPLQPRDTVNIICQIASALDATHVAGFIHRDVKPSNILLDSHDGRAKLTDFGLVKNDTGDITREGVVAGTPEYLSPEQATGHTLDSRSDLYSLGITLYECLTGNVPFRGTTWDIVEQHISAIPISPRFINLSVPKDLETICLKCLAKKPEQRYGTAAQLCDDLERWSTGRPILARPTGRIERGIRWCVRNPWPLAIVCVSLVGVIASTVGWWQALESKRLAESHSSEALIASSAAKLQSGLADQRALLAIDSINVLVTKSQNLIGAAPGTLNLKKQLNELALIELRKLTNGFADLPGAARSTILAHLKLGDSLNLLGQSKDAIQQWQLAIEVCSRRLQDNPNEWLTVQDMARAHNSIGFAQNLMTDYTSATVHMDASIQALAKAYAQNPQDVNIITNLGAAHSGLADVWRNRGRTIDSLNELERACKFTKEALSLAPDNSLIHQNLFYNRSRVAYLQRDSMHDYVAAEATIREQRSIVEEHLKHLPHEHTWQWYQRLATIDYSSALQRLCRFSEAEETARSVLEVCEKAVAIDPDNVMRQRDLVMVWTHIGASQLGAEKFPEAQASYTKALAILEAGKQSDHVALIATDLVDVANSLAITAIRTRDYTAASATYEKVLKYAVANLEVAGNQLGAEQTRVSINYIREALKCFPLAESDPSVLKKLSGNAQAIAATIRIFWLARQGNIELADSELLQMQQRFPDSFFSNAAQAGCDGQAAKFTRNETMRSRRIDSGCKAILQAADLNPYYLKTLYLIPETIPLRNTNQYRERIRYYVRKKIMIDVQ